MARPTSKSTNTKKPIAEVISQVRVLRTSHFTKSAKKAGIPDGEIRRAGDELSKGQGDPLGGDVWKKRVNENRHRAVVIARKGGFWIFVYLFAKKDRDNITNQEKVGFKKLAKDYGAMNESELARMLKSGDLEEIKDGSEKK